MSPEDRRHRARILKNRPHHRRPKNRRPNTKLTGERSEAAFLARVMYMNFGVSKPWGDSRKYDFILDNGELPLIRIQVKCTESLRAGAYETAATYIRGNKHIPYSKKDCDFIAAHVVPLDLWYIVPVEVSEPAPMLRFYPHRKPKYERLECYKEAWHLILPKKGVVNGKIDLQACADESATDPDLEDFEEALHSRPATAVARASGGEGKLAATDADSPIAQLLRYRDLCAAAPITPLDPKLAPWPLPQVKILAHRQGKHLLPEPTDGPPIKSP